MAALKQRETELVGGDGLKSESVGLNSGKAWLRPSKNQEDRNQILLKVMSFRAVRKVNQISND